jgi:acetoin utilization deacetylase AcuC-like enzyme
VAIWTQTLRTLARTVRPGLLVVSPGYDFVAGDPIGDLGVAASAMRQIGRIIREIATEYCEGRALFVLEGGYDAATLATCVIETISVEGPVAMIEGDALLDRTYRFGRLRMRPQLARPAPSAGGT